MDNSGKEAEAMALLAEAERKVKNSQSFFSGLFGGSSKIEEACEIYTRAANMFKMAKNWSAAGNAFCQAAQLHLQLQSKHDAATCFVDAGNAFKKADPQGEPLCDAGPGRPHTSRALPGEALRCPRGSGFFQGPTHAGGWQEAGRQTLGLEPQNWLPSGWHLHPAPSLRLPLLLGVRSRSLPSRSREHLGVGVTLQTRRMPRREENLFCCQNHACMHTHRAGPETTPSSRHGSPLTCTAGSGVDLTGGSNPGQARGRPWPLTRLPAIFLQKLLDAHEEQNIDSYTEAVKEYDSISRLDQWLTTMLLRIKKTIQGDEEDLR
uniref:alpha-soluble NSF attachment protein n=1 Tax=Panthera onca TaxID=9690 RepID=UPI002953B2DF|nr:alpha-soluble NSF attachment protein [Panthera onca]